MKKQVILAIALLVSFTAFSQKTHRVMGWKISKDIPRNELKLNLATTVFALYPEFSYERVLDSDISLGASLGVALDPDIYFLRYSFTPYVRWFFGGSSQNLQKYGTGFFIEANAAVIGREDSNSGTGLGLAVGWKYLTQNNWIGELYFGGGRDFANDGAYPRFGVSVGKRF